MPPLVRRYVVAAPAVRLLVALGGLGQIAGAVLFVAISGRWAAAPGPA
jgi:hypothetical protein